MSGELFIGLSQTGSPVSLNYAMANRHGLIAGATGTGKTATLRVLAEGFSRVGVPVFTADVKGDLAGLSRPGLADNPKIAERVASLKLQGFQPRAYPVVFWDVAGKNGHPLRTTIAEFGPLLLSRLFDLNDTQSGVLNIAFKLADDEGLLLLDLSDLRSLLGWMGEHQDEIQPKYGAVAKSSIAAIQRDLLTIEEAGGDIFFGEPALRLPDLMRTDLSGQGIINVLDATSIVNQPRVYTTFLLWLLSELFEALPEVGDVEKPRLVFFFDEAHLLFENAPKPLLEKIEQLVRLIRSKGVGVYFVTQNPLDIPDSVLGQLGNRVQHALRAFTPRDEKAVKSAATTFRVNPAFDTKEVITQLAVGEALVSVLDTKGVPSIVERTMVAPPASRLGAITPEERAETMRASGLAAVYNERIDRESAHEILQKKAKRVIEGAEEEQPKARASQRQGFMEAFFKSTLRTVGNQIGREIMRGVMGGLKRKY